MTPRCSNPDPTSSSKKGLRGSPLPHLKHPSREAGSSMGRKLSKPRASLASAFPGCAPESGLAAIVPFAARWIRFNDGHDGRDDPFPYDYGRAFPQPLRRCAVSTSYAAFSGRDRKPAIVQNRCRCASSHPRGVIEAVKARSAVSARKTLLYRKKKISHRKSANATVVRNKIDLNLGQTRDDLMLAMTATMMNAISMLGNSITLV